MNVQKLLSVRLLTNHNAAAVRRASFVSRIFKRKNDASAADESEFDKILPEGPSGSITEVEYHETLPAPLAKSYTPPAELEDKVLSIAQLFTADKVNGNTPLADNHFKFKVISTCVEEFKFDVPSHELSELRTLQDVVQYYSESRQPETPEEKLKNANLPGNVSLQLTPIRFTESTKHLFGGKTAFPQRDTVISSLKYRDVYEGYKNEKVYKKKDGFQYF